MVLSPVNNRLAFTSACSRTAYITVRGNNKKRLFTNGTHLLYLLYPKRVSLSPPLCAKGFCLTFLRAISRFTAVCSFSKKLYYRVFLLAYFANKLNGAALGLVVTLAFLATKATAFSGWLKAHFLITVLAKLRDTFTLWVGRTFRGARYSITPKLFATSYASFGRVLNLLFSVVSIVAEPRTKSTRFFSALFYFVSLGTFFTCFLVQCRHVIHQ
jgi:hypothetical protein